MCTVLAYLYPLTSHYRTVLVEYCMRRSRFLRLLLPGVYAVRRVVLARRVGMGALLLPAPAAQSALQVPLLGAHQSAHPNRTWLTHTCTELRNKYDYTRTQCTVFSHCATVCRARFAATTWRGSCSPAAPCVRCTARWWPPAHSKSAAASRASARAPATASGPAEPHSPTQPTGPATGASYRRRSSCHVTQHRLRVEI